MNYMVNVVLESWQSQSLEMLRSATLVDAETSFAQLLLNALEQPPRTLPAHRSVAMLPAAGPTDVGDSRPGAQATSATSADSKQRLIEIADRTAKKYGVNPRLVRSVISAESGFNPHAVSRAGAEGLMQLMPKTAAELGVKNPMNPEQNIDGGVRYLKQMLQRYGGNVSLALAAYNAGPGAVDRAGGIPHYRETQAYVRTVMRDDLNEMV